MHCSARPFKAIRMHRHAELTVVFHQLYSRAALKNGCPMAVQRGSCHAAGRLLPPGCVLLPTTGYAYPHCVLFVSVGATLRVDSLKHAGDAAVCLMCSGTASPAVGVAASAALPTDLTLTVSTCPLGMDTLPVTGREVCSLL